jgi:CheY-like chemotaxis protein
MSHEFRTPLNSILALSRLLLQRVDGDLTDEQAKQLAFIQKNAQDLSELVNDLLDLAKVEAGRITVNAGEVSVENLFGGLRGIFRPLLVNPLVTLTLEEPVGVPKMFTDEGKISQILRNFISNALKFTESGTVVVSARHDPAAETVIFSVVDTGIGIAPEDQYRIFEEFGQIDSPVQQKVKGTGLGLPLSRKLAELLGGRVTLESAPGRGSVFSAIIPVVYPGAIAAGGRLPLADLTRHSVLVISNERESVVLYEKYLKGTGFQVIPAGTAAEAQRRIGERKPLAILLDAALPRGASWELLMVLKRSEVTAGIPVFVVGSVDDAPKAFAFGADDCFVTPVDRKRLLERLRGVARSGPGGRILLIDDDEISRYIMRDLLSDTRYQVIDAASGEEGLRLAREPKPNVILLDLMMPGLSGFEVLELLERDPATRDIPVIIVTSKLLDEKERAFLSGRVVGVLSKESPSRQEAIAKVREALTAAELKAG